MTVEIDKLDSYSSVIERLKQSCFLLYVYFTFHLGRRDDEEGQKDFVGSEGI